MLGRVNDPVDPPCLQDQAPAVSNYNGGERERGREGERERGSVPEAPTNQGKAIYNESVGQGIAIAAPTCPARTCN